MVAELLPQRAGAWELGGLTDAESVSWGGGPRATASYKCVCRGAAWTESWPIVLVFGLGREYPEAPVSWTAGVDSPRYTAGQFTAEGLLVR